jgi:hypothetical protein
VVRKLGIAFDIVILAVAAYMWSGFEWDVSTQVRVLSGVLAGMAFMNIVSYVSNVIWRGRGGVDGASDSK